MAITRKVLCDNCGNDCEQDKKNYLELNIQEYLGVDWYNEVLNNDEDLNIAEPNEPKQFCKVKCLIEYAKKGKLDSLL